jgi:hypothetical protein
MRPLIAILMLSVGTAAANAEHAPGQIPDVPAARYILNGPHGETYDHI